MIPVKIGLLSNRVQNFITKDNEEKLRLALDKLECHRKEVAIRMAKYNGQIARYYNTKVRYLYFFFFLIKTQTAFINQMKKIQTLRTHPNHRQWSLNYACGRTQQSPNRGEP